MRHPGAAWVFVYTREAHPGENVPHHDVLDQKLAGARLLRDETGIQRPILVDDLGGTVHRSYGPMPSMTWVIDRGGRVAYRAPWTSAASVEAFVARLLTAGGQRAPGTMTMMYQTEQIEYLRTDREEFNRHLLRAGPSALTEFSKALPHL